MLDTFCNTFQKIWQVWQAHFTSKTAWCLASIHLSQSTSKKYRINKQLRGWPNIPKHTTLQQTKHQIWRKVIKKKAALKAATVKAAAQSTNESNSDWHYYVLFSQQSLLWVGTYTHTHREHTSKMVIYEDKSIMKWDLTKGSILWRFLSATCHILQETSQID